MEFYTISQVSKRFGISTRTLRYYEQIGLIVPVRKCDSNYREYEHKTLLQLRQIILLRKLRIPLRQIAEILQSGDAAFAIEAFERSLAEIEDELAALSTIRDVTRTFIAQLNLDNTKLMLLDDESLLEVVDALTVSKINFKEEKDMDDLNKANEKMNKITDKDVRILYLPPATVAAAHFIGEEPENGAGRMVEAFVKESNLEQVYPAARLYGFNHPNPYVRKDGLYGYEYWVTIPEGMEVPLPLEKKYFIGGLYAAYMIFPEDLAGTGWNRLITWAFESNQWAPFTDASGNLAGSQENMNDLLEEHLNYFNRGTNHAFHQFDLLLPIYSSHCDTTK
ncbi:MAG: effector binding domain-containing protein [Defluviitaleaceae bacterium]|nr:effector binding domain-containing protein [Defluviitaleaceae bacterium]